MVVSTVSSASKSPAKQQQQQPTMPETPSKNPTSSSCPSTPGQSQSQSQSQTDGGSGTRQVATVHPMQGGSNNGNSDGSAVFAVKSPPPPPPPQPRVFGGLRLKNFAVDPANVNNASQQQAVIPNVEDGASPSGGQLPDGRMATEAARRRSESPEVILSTWHTAEQRPQQQTGGSGNIRAPNVTFFANASKHISYRHALLNSRGLEER